jgi:pimeloyl-ACP methyl ester carboxylesterase
MKRFTLVWLVAVLAMALTTTAGAATPLPAAFLDLPDDFSHIGAHVNSFTTQSGHVLHYIDEGNPAWRTLVLAGGAGTGVQAFELIDFTRDLRNALHIRVICVERTGFGMTLFEPADASGALITATSDAALALADPVKTREMYAEHVLELLNHLGVDKFSVLGISGGGPYAAEIARQAASRVLSVHLAVAVNQAQFVPGPAYPDPTYLATMASWIINPMWWWDMTGSDADKIPGWQERAYDEGAWAAFVRGQDADPHAVGLDYTVFMQTPPDVSSVTAPVFTYYGEQDPDIPYPQQRDAWVAAFSKSSKITQRNYPTLYHDVQYRHNDQILVDVAGYGDYLIIAWEGHTKLIPQNMWRVYEARGAILGIQAWVTATQLVQ